MTTGEAELSGPDWLSGTVASTVVQLDSLSGAGQRPHSEPSGNAHRVIRDFRRSDDGDVRENAAVYTVNAHAARRHDEGGPFAVQKHKSIIL